MHYALQQHGARPGSKNATETAQKPMGDVARSALSGAVLSAYLRTLFARALGLPVLLLVSIFLGDWDFGSAGDCLPQAKKLIRKEGRLAGIADAAPAAWERRDDAPAAFQRVALQVGLSLRIVVRRLLPVRPCCARSGRLIAHVR